MDGIRSRAPGAAPTPDVLTRLYGRSMQALEEAAQILGAYDVHAVEFVDRSTVQRIARNMRATRAVVSAILEDRGIELDPRSGPLEIENHTRNLARVLQQTTLAQIRDILDQPARGVDDVRRLDEYRLYGVLHAVMGALRFAVWLDTAAQHTPPTTMQMNAAEFRAALADVRDDTSRSLGGVIRTGAEPTPPPDTTDLPLGNPTARSAAPRAPGQYALQPSPSAPPNGSSRRD